MSTITKDDIKEIISALHKDRKEEENRGKVVEWLFRALLGVIIWIGMGIKHDVDTLKNDVDSLNKSVSTIATERSYSEKDMEDLKEYTKIPRFTKQDFQTEMVSFESRVKRVEDIQNSRREEIDNMKEQQREEYENIKNRLRDLEYKMNIK